jgi:hypothetical protein
MPKDSWLRSLLEAVRVTRGRSRRTGRLERALQHALAPERDAVVELLVRVFGRNPGGA